MDIIEFDLFLKCYFVSTNAGRKLDANRTRQTSIQSFLLSFFFSCFFFNCILLFQLFCEKVGGRKRSQGAVRIIQKNIDKAVYFRPFLHYSKINNANLFFFRRFFKKFSFLSSARFLLVNLWNFFFFFFCNP